MLEKLKTLIVKRINTIFLTGVSIILKIPVIPVSYVMSS